MSSAPKVAIITGSSRGIGAGLVDGYRRAGFAVVGNALTAQPSDDPELVTVAGDISQVQTAQRIVDEAMARFGRIDTLVNNAGIYIGKPFTEYTVDDFTLITAVNLAGFFHITQRVIPQMVTQHSGHIVNVSTSIVDHAESDEPAGLASLTKGGLVAVVRSLAIEYAPHGVRANAVSLGVIRTGMGDPASYAALAAAHPLGRVGEVSDVVDGILYLEHAPFVTGETLHIDGGRAAGR
jgi:NAD(P)-dependent dehydrogenase (short-subunit alcohol dehydrogenase family)